MNFSMRWVFSIFSQKKGSAKVPLTIAVGKRKQVFRPRLIICTDPERSVFFHQQANKAVLRIRDVYPGSRIRLFSIPDPESELYPSRIPDPGSSSKNLSILTPKKAKKNGF